MAYKITEESLAVFKQKKIPSDVIKLLEQLSGQDFDKESEITNALEQSIGSGKTAQYKKIILTCTRNNYAVLYKKSLRTPIHTWHDAFKNNLGEQARLRRCVSPEEVLLHPGFHRLQQYFPKKNPIAVAAIAGLLAQVKTTTGYAFAQQLGKEKDHSGKAVFSELRFQQLLASRDINELYEHCRRAIMQLNRTANIYSLADGVLHWSQEQHDNNQFNQRPEQRFKFTWAKAYFNEVLTYSK